eukprot:gene2299-biopygen1897
MARKPFVTAVSAVVLISLVLMVAAPAGADTALPRAPLRKKPELACGSAEVEAKRMGEGPLAKAEPVLLAETNISFSTDDSYQSIRIGVFTKDLDSDSRYCTAAGEYRPDYQGNQVMCTADDVLTEAKKNILVNQLLPDAVKLHAERLKVKRSASGFIVPNFGASGGICAQFTIPAAHQSSSGVQGYDFVLYVAAGPTSGNTIAWALTCAANSAEGRPVVGMANISPRYIADDSRTVRTVTHEIAHALGFNYQQFTAAGMVGMASVRGKPSAPQLTSANVVAAGRDHFGWSGLTSVELEDEGGAGTAYSHWKRRNLKNELMAGIASIGYYTALTMAAFEDLGFYRVDYSKAEIMPWGYKAGEAADAEMRDRRRIAEHEPLLFQRSGGFPVHGGSSICGALRPRHVHHGSGIVLPILLGSCSWRHGAVDGLLPRCGGFQQRGLRGWRAGGPSRLLPQRRVAVLGRLQRAQGEPIREPGDGSLRQGAVRRDLLHVQGAVLGPEGLRRLPSWRGADAERLQHHVWGGDRHVPVVRGDVFASVGPGGGDLTQRRGAASRHWLAGWGAAGLARPGGCPAVRC